MWQLGLYWVGFLRASSPGPCHDIRGVGARRATDCGFSRLHVYFAKRVKKGFRKKYCYSVVSVVGVKTTRSHVKQTLPWCRDELGDLFLVYYVLYSCSSVLIWFGLWKGNMMLGACTNPHRPYISRFEGYRWCLFVPFSYILRQPYNINIRKLIDCSILLI